MFPVFTGPREVVITKVTQGFEKSEGFKPLLAGLREVLRCLQRHYYCLTCNALGVGGGDAVARAVGGGRCSVMRWPC